MTLAECISQVDGIEPNAYTYEQKRQWVSECEGKVYTQLFLLQPYEYGGMDYSEDNADVVTLALPQPYDKLYPRYLQAMIHYANGEYDRYANSMQMFNAAWHDAAVWFGQDYDISDRRRNPRITIEFTPGGTALNRSYYTQELFTIPEGHAFVGGRIVIKEKFDAMIRSGLQGQFYLGDPTHLIGLEIDLMDGDTGSIPVVIGERGGTVLGFITNFNATEMTQGKALITGILCSPEEEFFWRNREIRGKSGLPVYYEWGD